MSFHNTGFIYFFVFCFMTWLTVNRTSPQISQPALHERCCETAASPPSVAASAPSAAWRWRPANHGPQMAQNLIGYRWAHPLYRPIAFEKERRRGRERFFKCHPHIHSKYQLWQGDCCTLKQDKRFIYASSKLRLKPEPRSSSLIH